MQETLITFETAKLAKEKGFTMFKDSFKSALIDSRNYDVQKYSFYRVIKEEQVLNLNVGTNSSNINGLWESYNDKDFIVQKNYFAPTQSLLQKWLREKRSDITVITDWKKGKRIYYVGFSFVNDKNEIDIWFSEDEDENKIEYSDYEDALEVGLQEGLKLIEIIKTK